MLGLVSVLAMVAFQNCNFTKFSAAGPEQKFKIPTLNNGFPYDGKVYSSQDDCSDGGAGIQVTYRNSNSAEVTRRNCTLVSPAQPINASEFGLDPNNSDVMFFNQQSLFAVTLQNKLMLSAGTVVEDSGFVGQNVNQTPIFTNGVQAGSLLVCTVHHDDAGSPVLSISDTNGNSLVRAGQRISYPSGNGVNFTEVWYKENTMPIPAGQRMTIAYGGGVNGNDVTCSEYTGIATSGALDVVYQETGSNTNFSIPIPPRAQSNELVFVYFATCGMSQPVGGLVHRAILNGNTTADKFLYGSAPASVAVTSGCSDFAATVLTFRAQP